MPAVLHRYTQVLRRPDLINSKGNPLVTTARLKEVWTRLAGRLETVVADTSMITLSTEYAAHFHDVYINGKENAKMTGDRMKMLMLTQANSKQSTGCVRLDINLLKQSRIELLGPDLAPPMVVHSGAHSACCTCEEW